MITIIIICVLAEHWAKNFFHFTEDEIYEYGLFGIFFARIFGTDWIKK